MNVNSLKGSQLDLSNSDIVCPSNNCKTTLVDEGPMGPPILTVSEESGRDIISSGEFSLIDDNSNGHLSPKKQKFVEEMSFSFSCFYNDIQENTKKNTTKYICSDNPHNILVLTRKFNSTQYNYLYTASFEHPSGHFVLNATEDRPYVLTSGDGVYTNETGQIVVE